MPESRPRRAPQDTPVVFVGQLGDGARGLSRSQQRFEALRDLGFDVAGISYADLAASRPSLPERVRARVGAPMDVTHANQRVLQALRAGRVDVLWLDKALTIWPWTVWQARRLQPHLVVGVWLEEHVTPRVNRSVFLGGVLPQADCAFTPRSQNLSAAWLRRWRPRDLVLVDDTYDPEVHAPWRDEAGASPPAVTEVGFVGTYEAARAADLLYLAEHGVPVSVWGSHWHQAPRHPNLDLRGHAVFGREYAKTLCTTRINLCFLRKANGDRQTNRSFEIPATGSFMLAERTAEHTRLFEEGVEAAYFSSRQELLEKVRYYLSQEAERARIAAAGRLRCLRDGHSHQDRMSAMMEHLLSARARRDA